MKHKTQDPKFYIENNRLVGQSGPVPEDEPLFILRARDVNAVKTLCDYLSHAIESKVHPDHACAIARRVNDFSDFCLRHSNRMKVPDTSLKDMHDGKPS